jgi:hypothetical protein
VASSIYWALSIAFPARETYVDFGIDGVGIAVETDKSDEGVSSSPSLDLSKVEEGK